MNHLCFWLEKLDKQKCPINNLLFSLTAANHPTSNVLAHSLQRKMWVCCFLLISRKRGRLNTRGNFLNVKNAVFDFYGGWLREVLKSFGVFWVLEHFLSFEGFWNNFKCCVFCKCYKVFLSLKGLGSFGVLENFGCCIFLQMLRSFLSFGKLLGFCIFYFTFFKLISNFFSVSHKMKLLFTACLLTLVGLAGARTCHRCDYTTDCQTFKEQKCQQGHHGCVAIARRDRSYYLVSCGISKFTLIFWNS